MIYRIHRKGGEDDFNTMVVIDEVFGTLGRSLE